MTRLDDLLRAMDDRAAGAPDGAGVVEAAQRGAARIRRRHRVVRLTAAGCALALVAVGVPTILRLQGAPVVPAVPDRARTAQDMTLEIAPLDGATQRDYGTSTSGQFRSLSIVADGQERSFSVYAYPPGTPDRYAMAARVGAEPVTVRGQPGIYQSAGSSQELGWRMADGTLISVSYMSELPNRADRVSPADRAAVLRVAEAVRMGRPQPVRAPLQFGRLPGTLRFTGISVRGNPAGTGRDRGYLTLTLAFPESSGHDKRQVDVNVWNSPPRDDFARVADVNGYPAWFGHPSARRDALVIDTGPCRYEFLTSPGMSEAEVTALARDARFFPCDRPDTWQPPMG